VELPPTHGLLLKGRRKRHPGIEDRIFQEEVTQRVDPVTGIQPSRDGTYAGRVGNEHIIARAEANIAVNQTAAIVDYASVITVAGGRNDIAGYGASVGQIDATVRCDRIARAFDPAAVTDGR
jgi:hypothetical protein